MCNNDQDFDQIMNILEINIVLFKEIYDTNPEIIIKICKMLIS
jgi:hypothetical protein